MKIENDVKKLFLLLFILICLCSYSQKNIEVGYSAKKVEIDGTLVIQFAATNLNEVQLITPDFDGFKNVQGPQISRNSTTNIMNGKVSRSSTNTYTFYLVGATKGIHKIGGCKFKLKDGTMAESSGFDVEVVDKGTLPKRTQKQRRRPDPFDPFANDPFFSQFPGFSQRRRAPQPPPTQQQRPPQQNNRSNNGVYTDPSKIDLKKDVFARIELDKSKCYVGEQINASVKIYTSVNSNGFEAEQIPNFTGFWAQEIKLPEKLEMKRELVNGREFVSIEIKKLILFPTKAGKLKISPLKLKTVALVPVRVNQKNQRQPRDLFEAIQMMMNQQFGGIEFKKMPYSFSSGSRIVEVLPLPENAPESFTGAVGNYSMNAFCDKNKLKTDDVLQYKVEVQGSGNLPLINDPIVEWDEDFELFDPQLTENYNKSKVFNGTKSWNYSVIPHQPGDFYSPDLEFSYFDVSKKKYVILNSEKTQLKITGNPTTTKKKGTDYEKFNYAKQKIKQDSEYKSIRDIKSNTLYALSLLPLLCALGVFLIPTDRKQSRFRSDKKVSAEVKRQMNQAKKYLDKKEKEQFYNETTKAYWGYIGHKLKIETSELSRSNIEEKLKERQVSDETIQNLISLMNDSEMGLYTSHGQDEMKKLYEKSLTVLSKLEEEIA